MPLITIALGTIIVTGDIIIPIAIAAGTAITGSIGAYMLYRRRKNKLKKRDEQLAEFRAQQEIIISEAEALENTITHEVQIIDRALDQHHQLFQANIQKLNACVNNTEGSVNTLNQTTESIQCTEKTVAEITLDLQGLRCELRDINLKLHQTQDNLVEKEKALHITLKKLETTETKLYEDTKLNTINIEKLTAELRQANNLLSLDEHPLELSVKEAEIKSLQEDNKRMVVLIKSLESTIERFMVTLEMANKANKSQLNKITTLLSDNKQLNHIVRELSARLDDNKTKSTTKQADFLSHNIRMFKN